MWELLVLAVAFSVLPLLPWGVWLSKTAAAAVTLAASMLIAGKYRMEVLPMNHDRLFHKGTGTVQSKNYILFYL